MKRVCCVCKKYLGEVPGPKDMVTHGFCDPCLKIYRAEMFVALEKAGKIEPCVAKAMQGKEAHNKKDLSCVTEVMKDTSCVAGGEAG